jgi:uncharacterized alkaline shock family protein YloU
MNLFNRILVSLIGLIIGVVGTTIFLLLTGLVVPSSGPLKTLLALYQFWRFIALLRGDSANFALILGMVMVILGLGLFVVEWVTFWRSMRPRETRSYVVAQDPGGKLTVSQALICDVAQHEAEKVEGVRQARPTVKAGHEGLRIFMRTLMDPEAETPAVGKVLQTRVQEAVTQRVGLPVTEVQIAVSPAPATAQPHRRVE